MFWFFFSSRRRHTRWTGDWSSDVCSSDLRSRPGGAGSGPARGLGTGRHGLAPPRRQDQRRADLRPPAATGHSAARAGPGLGVPVAGGGPRRPRQLGAAAGRYPPRPGRGDPNRLGDRPTAAGAAGPPRGPAAGGDVRQPVRSGPVGAGRTPGRPAGAADPEAALLPGAAPVLGQGHPRAAAWTDLQNLGRHDPRPAGPVRGGRRSRAWTGPRRGLDQPARPGGPRGAVHRAAGPRRALAQERADPRPALAGLGRAGPAGRPAGGLALVPTTVRDRARLPLPQTGAGLDSCPSGRPGRGRPLELAAGARALGAVAGPPAGDRPPPALGASGRPHAAEPGPGAAGRRRTSGAAGQPDPSAPPTRECPRTAPRRAARAAATLPGRPPTQEAGSLNRGRPAFWPSASPPRPLGSHHLVQTPTPERSEGSGGLQQFTRSFTAFRMTVLSGGR